MTLVVITYNEARNIARCLDSVPFVAEKIVVDSGSTDNTREIAEAHGARVIVQPWLGFGPQRNFAASQASHDWIVALDADEFLMPELVAECRERLPAILDSDAAVVRLRLISWYMGAPLRWYRSLHGEYKARIYHRGRARWTEARVHESLQYDGPAVKLRAPFGHRNNPTLVHKQLKVLRYAELKALDWYEKRRSPAMWSLPFVFAAAFLKDYILRLACLDGWRGYVLAQTAASYAVYKRMRLYEMLQDPQTIEEARDLLTRLGIER